jgi:RNA 2',3'-cyclic 3'-phosphodiesterase
MIRLFIAITPSLALQQSFAEIRAVFQRQVLHWRWVQPEHVHLTLKFLGNVLPEKIVPIRQAMGRAVVGQAAFTLLARGLGCFPNLSRPRVLWMGLEPHPSLTQLQQRLEAELTPLSFAPEERAFRPHLTLARMPQGLGPIQLGPLLQTYHTHEFGEVAVGQLHLFQSQLHREGAVYTMLHSVILQR